MKASSPPVMLWERVIPDYDKFKQDPDGTLYAFKFPWSFAKGAKVRVMPIDKSEYEDCLITGCFMNAVRRNDWSIEYMKEKK